MVTLSTTAFNDAARCLKKYQYRHVDGLVSKPKDVRPVLRRGIWIHRLLQLFDEGLEWEPELLQMAKWAIEHDIPRDDVVALALECQQLVQDYIYFWAGHEEAPGPWTTENSEVKVEFTSPNGTVLTATLDMLRKDKDGRLWIWERKTTQDIPDSDWRTVDPQTMLQYVIARSQKLPVAGIMFDYVCTRPGPVPRVTQAGRLYKGDEDKQTRSRQFALTEAELRKHNAPESYIDEMRARIVSDALWFQRYPVFRPDDNARTTLKDVAAVVRAIQAAHSDGYFPRSLSLLDCRLFCTYGKLCMHEYQIGRESPAYREEYLTVTSDDLYSEGRSGW